MSRPLSPSWKVALFLALNLLDLALTRWLVQPGSTELREVNPIAGWWLRSWGWAGLVSFKLTAVAVAAGLFLMIARYRPGTAGRALNVSCLAVSLVVLYSGYLVASNGPAIADVHKEADKADWLAREMGRCRAIGAFQERTAEDLRDGRCTLAEATERLTRYVGDDARWLARLRDIYGSESDAEAVAALLIRHTVLSLNADPAAARRAAGRLGAEYEKLFGRPAPPVPLVVNGVGTWDGAVVTPEPPDESPAEVGR